MIRYWITLSLMTLVAVACTPEAKDQNELPGTVDVEALVKANNEAGFSLLHTLDTAFSNVLISPYSIQSAMEMTLQGARNKTITEMQTGLNLGSLSPEDVAASYPEWDAILKEGPDNTRFRSYNTLFYDADRLSLDDQFKQVMNDAFDAPFTNLDFDQPTAVDEVNQWVKTKTEGKIDRIIDQITDQDVMILLNALTLTGDWLYPFPVEATFDQDFHLPSGATIPTPMMHLDWSLIHERNNLGDVVQLPLKDSNYAVLFILPNADPVQQQVVWHQTVKSMFSDFMEQDHLSSRILLTVPRLEIGYKVLLNEPFKSLGMQAPFNPERADFAGFGSSSQGNMYIRRVDHRTYLKMDEKGIDGAAVTSVTVGETSLPPAFVLDRSFALIVYHLPTGTIIFDGVIHDPKEEG